MNSTKPAASRKRAALPHATDYTREFLKDWQRLTHSGRYDMNCLKEAMALLASNSGPMAPQWLDHALAGDWAGHRECHAGGDFLLIYRLENLSRHGLLIFVRAGTHADLFA
ncbi:type II toxin-antitoxin system YafQ family toxin [Amphibiibacter pelophylacis]|uniref:Type II toxin-antitoxin system YafQ family toxin n=1 Tax=Amphibiibacter pelophylacis TaxID=1799477 RepID=A0ACC6P221_9BURK